MQTDLQPILDLLAQVLQTLLMFFGDFFRQLLAAALL